MIRASTRPAVGDGWIGSWSPGIGDPTVMGWVTVALYFVAAWQVLRVARGRAVTLVRRESIPWWLAFLALLALGINKQLDLQSALTEAARLLSREQGWYEQRAELQKLFILQVGFFGLIAAAILAWIARHMPLPTRVAMVGLTMLIAFIAIRASSFHHVDLIIHSEWLGIRANWVFEIGGIVLVLLAARWRLRTRAPHTTAKA